MAPGAPTAIKKLYTDKLASSGLTTKQGAKLGFELTSPSDMKKLKLPDKWAIRMPYFDPRGPRTKFARYRYLEDTRSTFDIAGGKKQIRYVQAPGSLNEIYLPPFLKWDEICKDINTPLIITEGELKAACATTRGLPVLGLGGVWCFRSNANLMDCIPSLKWIKWDKREVTILFDSDAAVKPDIRRAESALCDVLLGMGAFPKIARMPKLEGMEKTGLDDYIVAQGHDGIINIIGAASDYRAAQELHRLNNEVVYVRNPGLIVKLDTDQRMTPAAFCEHAYATRTFLEEVETPNGTQVKTKSAPREWIKWPQRAEVEKAIYAPGKERIVDGKLNVWAGWAVEPKAGGVSLWNELLDYLFMAEPESRKWFEQWCAYPLQHPGEKLFTSAVIWGVHQGTGKSLIAYTLKQIYGRNFTEISEEHLNASHNEWCENKQFILGDEITGDKNRRHMDKLKGMISRQTIRLNPKFIPSYDIDDCINYYFTSNQPDSFFIEDKDRRFFIHEIHNGPLPRRFYDDYATWYKSDAGAAALFHHLLNLDTSDFNPAAEAPLTQSKINMISDTKSDLAGWIYSAKRDPDIILHKVGQPQQYDLWRSDDLLKIYDSANEKRVTVNGMSRELKKADVPRACFGAPCRTSHGQCRLWIMRNKEKYINMKADEVGALYDKERGEAVAAGTEIKPRKRKATA